MSNRTGTYFIMNKCYVNWLKTRRLYGMGIFVQYTFLILVRNNIMPNTTILAEKQIIKWCVAVNQIERLYTHIKKPSCIKERDNGDVD